MRRRSIIGLAASAAGAALLPAAFGPVAAEAGPEGLTEPVTFDTFDPAAASCAPQLGLSRTLAFARDNDRDFIDGVDHGLSQAAQDRGLAYVSVNADNDSGRMVQQLQDLAAQKVGAVVVAPVDSERSVLPLKNLIWSGAYVGAIVPPPATTILNAPQYLTGKVLAEAAATHIAEKLQGRANVVLMTHDSLQFLAPRFTAMRDVLRELPGAVIVADISPATVSEQGGFDLMTTILLAEPQIDVVLGADTVVLGALAAMRQAGKVRADQFFGGIDGEPAAVAELGDPKSPYRTSVSLASSVFGYAMGQHAADWIEGKSIPKAIDVLPIALTPETLFEYRADMADPGQVYRDAKRLGRYLTFYGNTCTTSKDAYVNFPWSSESKS
ncbi:MAG: sugar ABC transporter substrate-binding protein [Acetobacteraceae bacterium]|nr:MAG: sugar ABC transporter substrate-binding protein [Acetobacteraceae bacterium]